MAKKTTKLCVNTLWFVAALSTFNAITKNYLWFVLGVFFFSKEVMGDQNEIYLILSSAVKKTEKTFDIDLNRPRKIDR